MREQVPIEGLDVAAFTVPTDAPEADGTLAWDSTTLVLVTAHGGGQSGIGYTYSHAAAAHLIRDKLTCVVTGLGVMNVDGAWIRMVGALRNIGTPGLGLAAIAAVDTALWDLKARVLGVPLASLLGAIHASVPVYGSGGFTSYADRRLTDQLAGWVAAGIPMVKMKVGSEPAADVERVRSARDAIGANASLFVDANGAYDRKQALAFADTFRELGVSWFEEPVSSDDLEGLRLIRDRAPAGMDVTAGEYGSELVYFRRMLEAGAVDVLQADVTRCGGITGFLRVAALCDAFEVPLSAHTAPALHLHPCCAMRKLRHLEYFHDHVRIERMLFDGVAVPVDGRLHPDLSRPGLGLSLKAADAERYAA